MARARTYADLAAGLLSELFEDEFDEPEDELDDSEVLDDELDESLFSDDVLLLAPLRLSVYLPPSISCLVSGFSENDWYTSRCSPHFSQRYS